MNTIPQEIIDAIIDQLKDNSDSLKACSSVSHSFRPQCLKHFYNEVTLDICEDKHNQQLYDILTLNPAIKTYIRRLSLHVTNFEMDTLPRIILMLRHVRWLSLNGASAPQFWSSWQALPALLKSTIRNWIQSRDLTELSVYSIADFPLACLAGVQLKKFKIDKHHIITLLDLESPTSSHVQLVPGSIHIKHLEMGMLLTDIDVVACQQAVEWSSNFLEGLYVNVLIRPTFFVIPRSLDISCTLTKLRSLCFNFGGNYKSSLEWLPGCLSSVSSINNIEKVDLLFVNLTQPFEDGGWLPIDTLLASWTSRHLRCVSLKFGLSMDTLPVGFESIVTAFFTNCLPNLVSKGIIEMHWGPKIILPPLVIFDPVIVIQPETREERDPNAFFI